MTKTVEVYSYEDLTFTIDTYSVRQGDNIASILRGRGLWPEKGDSQREAQLLRLVGDLNPVIANLDQISPGQTLYLPAPGEPEPEPAIGSPEQGEDFAGVVTYELGQPDQTPARVVVRRPSLPETPPEEELGEGEYRLATGEPQPIPEPRIPFQATLQGTQPGTGQNASPEGTSSNSPSQGASQLDSSAGDDNQSVPLAPPKAPARAASQTNEGPTGVAEDGTVYRTVKVRKGDTLEKLLRREGLDRDLIYKHLLKFTVSLNPGLKNPNMIIIGAELRIPIAGDYLASLGGGSMAAAVAAPAVKTQRGASRDAASKEAGSGSAKADATASHAPSAGEKYSTPTKRLPAAAMPSADSVSARSVFGIIFTRLGEKLTSKGRLFLPLEEPPHFDVDTAKLPILELNNGRKIVLDLSASLSADLVKRFTTRYNEYQVFQPERREAFNTAF